MFRGHSPFAVSPHQPAITYSSISPPPFSGAGNKCLNALCLRYMPLHSLHYASGLRYIRTSFHYDPFAPFRSFSSTNLSTPHKRSSFSPLRSLPTLRLIEQQLWLFPRSCPLHNQNAVAQFHPSQITPFRSVTTLAFP